MERNQLLLIISYFTAGLWVDCHLIVEPKEINNAFTDFILIRVRYFFNLRVQYWCLMCLGLTQQNITAFKRI
jgi:hypothetical protein